MADVSRLAEILRSSGVVFLGRVLELGISFLGAAVVARLFGRADFGSVTVGATLLSTVGSLMLLGTSTGVSRYLPRFDDLAARRGVIVSAFQLVLPAAVLVAGALFLFAEPVAALVFDDLSSVPVIRVFALAVPLSVVVDLSVSTAKGQKDSLPQVYVKNLGIPVTRILGIVWVLAVGGGIVAIAWAYWTAYAVAAALGLWYVVRRSGLSIPGGYEPMRRELLVYSLPLVGSVIAAQILGDVDTFLLWFFHEVGDVGVYGVVYPLASLLLVFQTSINYLTMPTISELHAEDRLDELHRVYQVVTKWTVMASLPAFVVIVLFPETVIRLTYGPDYVAGGTALSVVATGFFVTLFAGPARTATSSLGDTDVVMWVTAGAAVLNVALNLVLIPPYSFLGAAAATAVAYVVMNGWLVRILRRRTGIQPLTSALIRPVVVALTIAGLVYAAVRTFLPITWPVLAGALLVYVALYAVVLLRFGGVEREEIDIVLRFEDRLGIDLTPVKRIAERLIGD
jgi:O-antigen/teichoic acid export membrane protein